MSGQTGQLQRLTDAQVSARLAAYNAGGALERDIKLLGDHVLPFIVAEIGAQFGAERGERYASVFSARIDAAL